MIIWPVTSEAHHGPAGHVLAALSPAKTLCPRSVCTKSQRAVPLLTTEFALDGGAR